MTTTDTRTAAQTYHAGWTSGSGAEAMRPVMAEGFTFTMGEMRIEGRESFLEGGGWPQGATVTMVAEAYDGDHGFQLYQCEADDRAVTMCEHFTVSDGTIASIELVVDHAALGAFLAPAGAGE